jgi:hypothetical protein
MKIEADFSRQHPNMGHDFPDASANYPTTAFQGRLVHFIYQSGIVVGLIFDHKATKERSQLGRSLATKARRHEVNGEESGHEGTKTRSQWGRSLATKARRHEVSFGGIFWLRRHEVIGEGICYKDTKAVGWGLLQLLHVEMLQKFVFFVP